MELSKVVLWVVFLVAVLVCVVAFMVAWYEPPVIYVLYNDSEVVGVLNASVGVVR